MSPDAADLYRRMKEIRLFEDEVVRLFTRNLVRGSTHLCQGQEAVVVGACRALREGDTMTCSYRGHGALLAMGAPLDRSFGEILGRANGLCHGAGGSMHLTDVSIGALGSFAIVGAHLPVAVGAAFSAMYLRTGAVSLCFFGDGATNIGAFHEALNLAAVWKVPAVFVCKNNLYGEYSPLAATTPIDRLADRAAAYGMPGIRVDGNDVWAMYAAVAEAAEVARAGQGPTLIEAMTYRHLGHSRSDPATYRPPDELEAWLERDPLVVCRDVAVATGQATVGVLGEVDVAAKRDVKQALERALAWPEPAPEAVYQEILA
jgi:pyruvate dehydrogenase E1 component alpha subunit